MLVLCAVGMSIAGEWTCGRATGVTRVVGCCCGVMLAGTSTFGVAPVVRLLLFGGGGCMAGASTSMNALFSGGLSRGSSVHRRGN